MGDFPEVSRRATTTVPSARSRGPSSTRTGTPLSSHSVARRPNAMSTRSSRRTRTPPDSGGRPPSGGRPRDDRPVVVVTHDQHHHLHGRQPGGHPQPGVVTVAHDQPAHHAGRGTPGRGPAVCWLPSESRYSDAEGPGEVLAQLVAGAHLQGLAVAHHGLTGQGVGGTGEALLGDLAPDVHGQGQHVDHEVAVHLLEDPAGRRPRRRPRSHGRYGPPATGTPRSAGTPGGEAPSGRRSPTGSATGAGPGRTGPTWP